MAMMMLVLTHIKKYAYPLVMFCSFSMATGITHAQDSTSGAENKDAQQKIEALKMAYLTQQLDLSPKEAEKFWPLYNQYQKDMHHIIKQRQQAEINKNQLNRAGNAQIEQSMNKDFQLQQQALQLRQKYRKKFQDVLPPRKVMKVYRSEKDFNMKLIEELHRRQDKSPGRVGPGSRPRPSAPTLRPTRRQAPQSSRPVRRFSPPERSNPPAHRPVRSTRPGRH